MKIIARILIFACVFVAASDLVVGYLMFGYKAAGLIFSACISIIGIFECFRALDDMEGNDDDDI